MRNCEKEAPGKANVNKYFKLRNAVANVFVDIITTIYLNLCRVMEEDGIAANE